MKDYERDIEYSLKLAAENLRVIMEKLDSLPNKQDWHWKERDVFMGRAQTATRLYECLKYMVNDAFGEVPHDVDE